MALLVCTARIRAPWPGELAVHAVAAHRRAPELVVRDLEADEVADARRAELQDPGAVARGEVARDAVEPADQLREQAARPGIHSPNGTGCCLT